MPGSKLTSRLTAAHSTMRYDIICRWLDLTVEQWPPDHYTLLGLPRGEGNLNLLEASVHDRLNRVRCYQLSHPEPATEAMNRLAEAYACLCDPKAKKEYDRQLGVRSQPLTRGTSAADKDTGRYTTIDVTNDTVTNTVPTVVAWDSLPPPPVRGAAVAEVTNGDQPTPGSGADEPPPAAPAPVEPAPSAAADKSRAEPVRTAPWAALAARRGLGTPRALYQRILLTRELFAVWRKLGKFLSQPLRKLGRPGEDKELWRGLNKVDELLIEFPPFLGRPGKGGYRVAILARDENPVRAFLQMDPTEREALALDWTTGMDLLRGHLQFLRQEVKRRRHESWILRLLRPPLSFLEVHQRPVLLTLLAILLCGSGIAVVFLLII